MQKGWWNHETQYMEHSTQNNDAKYAFPFQGKYKNERVPQELVIRGVSYNKNLLQLVKRIDITKTYSC